MTGEGSDRGHRRARSLIAVGLAVMVLAALDPLEGSVGVVGGGGLIALGARMRESRHRVYLYCCLAMLATGVAALWIGADYAMGTAQRPGTGVLPRILAWCLVGTGGLLWIKAFLSDGPDLGALGEGAHAGQDTTRRPPRRRWIS